MIKHRLELFSDGVFAIVLTLLVLDLRLPAAQGPAGLSEIAPELLVHAATFFAVGGLWMVHHSLLGRVLEITSRTLILNLLVLFWITLLPFAAKNAAEHPNAPLGASLMAGSCGAFFASALAMRLSAHSATDDNPNMRRWKMWRLLLVLGVVLTNFAGAAAAWIWPWTGYTTTVATIALVMWLPTPAEVERKMEREAA